MTIKWHKRVWIGLPRFLGGLLSIESSVYRGNIMTYVYSFFRSTDDSPAVTISKENKMAYLKEGTKLYLSQIGENDGKFKVVKLRLALDTIDGSDTQNIHVIIK